MSDVESYVGKLTPVDLGDRTLDEWIMDRLGTTELESYYQSWWQALEDNHWKEYCFDSETGTLYSIEKKAFDPEDMSIVSRNDDGTYDFVVSFYNGGTNLPEMLQKGMKDA